jgi:hypothetical protein
MKILVGLFDDGNIDHFITSWLSVNTYRNFHVP